MTQEEKFWNWFKENSSKYYFLNQIKNVNEKENLLDNFLIHLHDYSDKLFFEIGGVPNEEQELVISAGGNKEYFNKAEKLVSKAPKIKNWKIYALKPPMGVNFITKYEEIELNPLKIWFLPLENESDPEALGLRLCIENYNPQSEDLFLNAAYQMLDTVLGEKSNALDIKHIELNKLPAHPEKEGLIELSELSKYINWRKGKMKK